MFGSGLRLESRRATTIVSEHQRQRRELPELYIFLFFYCHLAFLLFIALPGPGLVNAQLAVWNEYH